MPSFEIRYIKKLCDDTGHEHDTWIDVSILGGWLLAYEGVTPDRKSVV